jgi:tetratricopeptide (TPR) repeat protein
MGVSRGRRRTGLGKTQTPPLSKLDSTAAGPPDAAMWGLLLCAPVLAYLPALRGGLLWDDQMHVTRPELRSLHGLWRIWFDLGATQQYYPLLHSAFWLEHRLWGDAVLGYHLVNVALHAASACLVVMIVRRVGLRGAWLAGFLFALHPVCVEAVAWMSEQKSTLSAVFYLAAALLYLQFDRTRGKSSYFLAFGLFLLALVSKSVTATLPAALLLIFWWRRGRIDWRRDGLPLAPWFAVAIPAGLFTAWVERAPQFIGAQGADYALSMPQHIILAGRVLWFYAWKVLWPSNLMFIYPRWTIDPGQWWQHIFPLGIAAVALGLGLLARRNRGPLAAFLFFAGTLSPVLGFLNVYPFRYSWVADHFQYLAALGIIVPAAAALAVLSKRISSQRLGAFALPFLVLTLLGCATWRQSRAYRDYETLFRETLARNPESALVHNNLGVMLMSSGREPAAVPEFEAAVRLTPGNADYRVNLGLALAQMPGRILDAIAEYQTALRIDPHFPAAHLNLGLALTSLPGRLPNAIAEYQKAVSAYQAAARSEPALWEAHFNLGLAYAQTAGREADAIDEYRTALRMKPDSALAYFHLGNTFHKMGRLPEAIAEYRKSVSVEPGVPEVHYELAYALAQVPGGVPEAIVECQRMLLLKPDDKPGRQLMESLLAFQAGQQR